MKTSCLLLFLFSFSLAQLVWAEGDPEKKSDPKSDTLKEPAKSSDFEEPKVVVTHHTAQIGGKPVHYTATVGYLLFKEDADAAHSKTEDPGKKAGSDEKDSLKARAKIFFIAYTRDGTELAERPITFAFNGGPGAASVWLHLGALGPRRVALSQPDGLPVSSKLLENDSSWLDDTDLVFIDPVSTGYSRPVPGVSADSFHDFEADNKSVAEFIRLYVTKNQRWQSPKFIIGESYGGARAIGVTAYLQERFALNVKGVVLVSALLDYQAIQFSQGNDLPYPLFLPSYAMAAWQHQKLSPELQKNSLAQVRQAAEEFADHDYLLALHQGSALSPTAQKDIAGRLSALTGLPVDLILRYHLRIPAPLFMQELLKSTNQVVGRFDSRYAGFGYDPEGDGFDPSFEAVRSSFTAAINDYLRNDLKFVTDLPYETLAPISWNLNNSKNRFFQVDETLGRIMTRNPALKVWAVAGDFDLAIASGATQYSLRQLTLDPALRPNLSLSTYESGHMIYTSPDVLKKFKADFEIFLGGLH